MGNTILSQTVSEFYRIQNKNIYTKLKNLIAPIICYVERNLNEVSYKKYGIGAELKEKFPYLAQRLTDDELSEFIKFYKKIRALNVHVRTYYSKSGMKQHFTFDLSKLASGDEFLGLAIPYTAEDGELTIYGMLFVLSILLDIDQFWALLNMVVREPIFTMPQDYRVYDKKNTIRQTFVALNTVKKTQKDIPLIFCAEQYVIPIVAEAFLILEEDILSVHDITPAKCYLSFPEILQPLDIDGNMKEKLRHLRNMWAHGNCFYYISPQDNVVVEFIDIMRRLLQSRYERVANNALKKLKHTLLQLKYKRPTEMAIKLQVDRTTEEGILHRLSTMTGFRDKDELVPLFIEEKLSEIDCDPIKFGYNNKEEKLGVYYFSRIEIIIHHTDTAHPFVVDGFQTNLTEIREYRLPEYDRLHVETVGGHAKDEKMIAETAFVRKISVQYGA